MTALQAVADVGARMRAGDRAGAVRVAEQACSDVSRKLPRSARYLKRRRVP